MSGQMSLIRGLFGPHRLCSLHQRQDDCQTVSLLLLMFILQLFTVDKHLYDITDLS